MRANEDEARSRRESEAAAAAGGAHTGQGEGEDHGLLDDNDSHLVPQLKGQARKQSPATGPVPQNGAANGVPEGAPESGAPKVERAPVLELAAVESVTVPSEAGPVTLSKADIEGPVTVSGADTAGPAPPSVGPGKPPGLGTISLDKPLSRGPPQSLSDYSFLWNEALLNKEAAKSGLYQALRPKVRKELQHLTFLPIDKARAKQLFPLRAIFLTVYLSHNACCSDEHSQSCRFAFPCPLLAVLLSLPCSQECKHSPSPFAVWYMPGLRVP